MFCRFVSSFLAYNTLLYLHLIPALSICDILAEERKTRYLGAPRDFTTFDFSDRFSKIPFPLLALVLWPIYPRLSINFSVVPIRRSKWVDWIRRASLDAGLVWLLIGQFLQQYGIFAQLRWLLSKVLAFVLLECFIALWLYFAFFSSGDLQAGNFAYWLEELKLKLSLQSVWVEEWLIPETSSFYLVWFGCFRWNYNRFCEANEKIIFPYRQARLFPFGGILGLLLLATACSVFRIDLHRRKTFSIFIRVQKKVLAQFTEPTGMWDIFS